MLPVYKCCLVVSTAALVSILSMLQCAFLGCVQPSCTGRKSHYFHGCHICVHVTEKECATARMYISVMFIQ